MNILIFGGTFDPIHYGHLRIAMTVQDLFHFEKFIFLPCKISALKTTAPVNQLHRCAMLKLAFADHQQYNFTLDPQEVLRELPSYMVLTLQNYRQHYGDTVPITLMLGSDSFYQLPQWHAWNTIMQISNLLIIERMNYATIDMPHELQRLLRMHQQPITPQALLTEAHGVIHWLSGVHYDISSTKLRNALKHRTINSNELPVAVYEYIVKQNLY